MTNMEIEDLEKLYGFGDLESSDENEDARRPGQNVITMNDADDESDGSDEEDSSDEEEGTDSADNDENEEDEDPDNEENGADNE